MRFGAGNVAVWLMQLVWMKRGFWARSRNRGCAIKPGRKDGTFAKGGMGSYSSALIRY